MSAAMISLLVAVASLGQSAKLPQQEIDYQQQTFRQWWGESLELRLDQLPTEGSVPEFRTPYSGHDYPDRAGGTVVALMKYDRAFNNGRSLAVEFERRDVGGHRSRRGEEFEMRRGLFGRIRMIRTRGPRTPAWYGHCNGWTAAAIRHAEPQYSVVRNGIVFTPADIKGLLAEIYMYTDTEFLGGIDSVIHPAIFHISLTNWLGRGSHPIGMEAAVGEVVINYPIYSYKSSVIPHGARQSEVRMTVTYAMNTAAEAHRSPRYSKQMYFHYMLDLDAEGKIVGGRYYGDSARIDMLWAPLQPVQGGKKGNERGNPHVDVKTVLALWRESVPAEMRQKWLNIDPTDEDRILPPEPPSSEPLTSEPPPSEAAISEATTADAPTSEATPTSEAPASEATPSVTPTTDSPAAGSESPAGDHAPASSPPAASEEPASSAPATSDESASGTEAAAEPVAESTSEPD